MRPSRRQIRRSPTTLVVRSVDAGQGAWDHVPMTTTVTTTTITTATTVGVGAAIVLVVVLLLIGFLMAKEITTSVNGGRAQSAGRVLSVGIVPLLIAFATIVASKLLPMFGA
jgi:hypothetical protein